MTSEYVTVGHPDRMADYISEYILDRYLEKDKFTRYALEVQVKDNFVTLSGEITSSANLFDQLGGFVRDALREIGYTEEYAKRWGVGNCIDPSKVIVTEHISHQSSQIAQGVNNLGWGDQGIFWGMAINNENTNYMPYDHWLARKIGEHIYEYARYGNYDWGLDIKVQVTTKNNVVSKVIVAVPLMNPDVELQRVKAEVKRCVGRDDFELIVNGTGSYVCHSSMGDCGTTGRKLAVDFYGGNCRIGGGSPWTKDPTKADLTLNLYARKKALEYLKEHNLYECHVQIECCIGRKEITIEYYDGHMNLLHTECENKSNGEIIDELGLREPIYAKMALNGMFSRINCLNLEG